MITVKILADSVNPSGSRLTSFLTTYPRFIHSEFMTHRVFSRNAASSRARPLRKMVDVIDQNPAMPERWGAEQKGMQSGEEVARVDACVEGWQVARDRACQSAEYLSKDLGLHKSIVNRLIEPFAHITVLATAADKGLSNFFALRAHPAAQPEFQVLAYRMLDAYLKSAPQSVAWGDWHVPAFTFQDNIGKTWADNPAYYKDGFQEDTRVKVATARCARLSYLTFDGEHSVEKDIELHDRLIASGHMSPAEHCALAEQDQSPGYISNFDTDGEWSGWLQYRKMLEGENQLNANLTAIMASKPEWITL